MSHPVAAVRKVAEAADQSLAVIATDLAGRVVFWNAAAERLYGWASAEAMGRDIIELTPTQMSKDEGDEIMESLRAGRPWTGAFMVRNKAGEPMVVHVEDIPVIEDGNVVGIVGLSRLTSVG